MSKEQKEILSLFYAVLKPKEEQTPEEIELVKQENAKERGKIGTWFE